MAIGRSKKYTLQWPLNSNQVLNIDEMFDDLYKRLSFAIAGELPNANGLTTGDLLAFDGLAVIGINDVAVGNVLISGGVGLLPSFDKVDLTLHVSGVLPVVNGGTGLSTFAQGDIIYASAINVLAKLAKSTSATRYLSNTGTDNNPAWAQVNLADGVTGTLPIANGGTNATAFTAGSVIFAGASGTSLAQDNGNFFWDDTNNRLGLGLTNPGGKLEISFSESTDAAYGFKVDGNHTTATGGTVYGAQFNARVAHTTGTQNAAQGFFQQLYYRGTSASSPAVSGMTGVFSRLALATPLAGGNVSGTISTGTGFEIDSLSNQAGGSPSVTFTTMRGLIIRDQGAGSGSGGLTITTAFGSGVAEQTAATNMTNALFGTLSPPTGTWNIYSPSTRNSHFAGPLLIGSTTAAGAGTNYISFADGTIPSSLASNTAIAYADDVGGTTELFGINESGVTNQLTGLQIRKTADESVTNSTTHQADDHLTVQLAASSAYEFEIYGFWTTAGATAGITVQIDGTAGVSSLKADVLHYIDTSDTFTTARITAFNSAVGVAGTGDNSFVIKGVIEVSTAGTLFLEWAQNSADAVNATIVQENSFMVLRKLNA